MEFFFCSHSILFMHSADNYPSLHFYTVPLLLKLLLLLMFFFLTNNIVKSLGTEEGETSYPYNLPSRVQHSLRDQYLYTEEKPFLTTLNG